MFKIEEKWPECEWNSDRNAIIMKVKQWTKSDQKEVIFSILLSERFKRFG